MISCSSELVLCAGTHTTVALKALHIDLIVFYALQELHLS